MVITNWVLDSAFCSLLVDIRTWMILDIYVGSVGIDSLLEKPQVVASETADFLASWLKLQTALIIS